MMGADGKPVMKQTPKYNEDGSIKMKTVETGQQAGIVGQIHNVKKEVSDTYKSYQKKEE